MTGGEAFHGGWPLPDESQRVAGDRRLLGGLDHEDLDAAASGRDQRFFACVFRLVQFEAKPVQIFADLAADADGIFADAAAEDQSIETAQGSGKAAKFVPDAGHEVVDGLLGLRPCLPLQARACRR